MELAKFCTVMLFVVISFGLQILNWWLISAILKQLIDDDWLILGVIIFLWNVIAPVFLVYKVLVERGML